MGRIPGVLLGRAEAEQESLERPDLGMGRFSLRFEGEKKKREKRRWEQEFQAKEKLLEHWDNPAREFVGIREGNFTFPTSRASGGASCFPSRRGILPKFPLKAPNSRIPGNFLWESQREKSAPLSQEFWELPGGPSRIFWGHRRCEFPSFPPLEPGSGSFLPRPGFGIRFLPGSSPIQSFFPPFFPGCAPGWSRNSRIAGERSGG